MSYAEGHFLHAQPSGAGYAVPGRRRGADKRENRASPEARQHLSVAGPELRVILASEELLDHVRNVARRIQERVRQVLGLKGPRGPERGSPERTGDVGARPRGSGQGPASG
jgi:hypothetical protein